MEKRRKLAVSLFLAILCDPDRDLRQAAAEALGRLGERRAESGLVRARRDPDADVRSAVERALQALVGARAGG
jgi:HEAT repeat protein